MSKKNKISEVSCSRRKTSIGGQALMEGIMMRGPEVTAMAVRNTEGEIVLEKFPTQKNERSKFFKLPIIRGVFNFIDSMKTGYKCLMRSAEISGLEELEREAEAEKKAKKEAKKAKKAAKASAKEKPADQPAADTVTEGISEETAEAPIMNADETGAESEKEEKKDSSILMNVIMVISMVLGMGLGIFLFFFLPTWLYDLLQRALPFLPLDNEALNSLVKSFFEGILKIIMIVAYMLLVSLMGEIKKTFQYHGAEHKTIFCYENGLPLTVENVRNQRRFHPRCGTSFIILMLLVSIVISFFIDPIFLLTTGSLPNALIRAFIKILLIPLMMGIGYELLKLAGRYDNLLIRIISAPGLWLQRVTVLEPNDDMIECAITAFIEVMPEDEKQAELALRKTEEPEETTEETTQEDTDTVSE